MGEGWVKKFGIPVMGWGGGDFLCRGESKRFGSQTCDK